MTDTPERQKYHGEFKPSPGVIVVGPGSHHSVPPATVTASNSHAVLVAEIVALKQEVERLRAEVLALTTSECEWCAFIRTCNKPSDILASHDAAVQAEALRELLVFLDECENPFSVREQERKNICNIIRKRMAAALSGKDGAK